MANRTPTPWMTNRAGEMAPNDWMIVADRGIEDGIQQISTVARALSIRQTPEVTAANAAFIVNAANNHDALVAALTKARARIHYLGVAHRDPKHFDSNERDFLPEIDAALQEAGR